MRKHQPKYRPSLTMDELQDCVTALQTALPSSPALVPLQLYLARVQITATAPAVTEAGKPSLPPAVQAKYEELYTIGYDKVITKELTEEELNAQVWNTLLTEYPDHTAVIQLHKDSN